MSILSKLLRRSEGPPTESGPLFRDVQDAMRGVQAYARSHGGEIQLLGVSEEGDVKIRLKGTCSGCPMAGITLKLGVEQQLRALVPGIRKVVQIR